VASITFGAGPDTKWQEEQRRFLHQRLRLLAPMLFFLSLLIQVRIYAIFGMWGRMSAACSIGMLAASAALLLVSALLVGRPGLTGPRLRRIELLLLLLITMVSNFLWSYGWLQGGRVLASVQPAVQELLRDAVWVIAPDRITQVRVGPTLISFPMVNNWSLLSVVYGILVPNTWRRGLLVQGLILLCSIATLIVATLANPGLRPFVGGNVASLLTSVGCLAAIGLYGGHKFEALRKKAFDAQQIGQYRLVRLLGKGAMGEVYLAHHRLLRRPCALKLIRPEQAGRPDYITRFEREAQAMAQLTHPNTVEVYDFGTTEDGTFYYAMQYLPGMNLDALVRAYGPLPAGRVVHLLRQMCGALAEAHRQGLIHRDIKPGNIILCERGGVYDVVKLLDFGLVARGAVMREIEAGAETGLGSGSAPRPGPAAAPSRAADLGALHTHAGMLVGTPAFMSPEQVCGEPADPRSDLYSLGGVAYFLLTGRQPFERETLAEVCAAHVSEPVPSLRSAGVQVPAALESVIERCLAKDRAARYRSAEELGAALEQIPLDTGWDSAAAAEFWRAHAAAAPSSLPSLPPSLEQATDGSADTLAAPGLASPPADAAPGGRLA
jgi:serine/threonine-protein kinase